MNGMDDSSERTLSATTSAHLPHVLLILVGLALLAGPAAAQLRERQKLKSSDRHRDDMFGYGLAVSGDLAVCGSPLDDDYGTDSGSVYCFRKQDGIWQEQSPKIYASDAAARDEFGYSVATTGEVMAVGAPYLDENGNDCGAIYMFRWDGSQWHEEDNRKPGSTGDRVGWSVAADGPVIVVGAPYDDMAGTDAGAVYVYRYRNYVGWSEDVKLFASDAAASDHFGCGVSISGNSIVVGSDAHDHLGNNSGGAYIYRYQDGEWTEEQELVAPDGMANDELGSSVAVSGGVCAVGAHKHDHGTSDAGACYLFRFDGSGWAFEQELTASDRVAGDQFGRSVALAQETLIVGAPGDDDSGGDSGSAYIFRYCDGCACWLEDVRLLGSDRNQKDHFGRFVATDGTHAISRSADWFWDNGDHWPGAAYIHDVRECVLAIDPTEVSPGDTLTLDAYSGPALSPMMLTATAFDGVPLFKPLFVTAYGPNCDFVIQPTIGPEWSGHTLTLITCELGTCGSVVCSDPESIIFQ